MSPADFRFYCTDWHPNGTSGLFITDNNGQCVAYIDEALFGPVLDHNRNGETFGGVSYCDGDSVWLITEEPETIPQEDIVYPLLLDDVLSSIAVSPVQSRMDVLRCIVAALKGVKS
jgi:hypothetical protein